MASTWLLAWRAAQLVKTEHVEGILRHALMRRTVAIVVVVDPGFRTWSTGVGQVQGIGVGRQLDGRISIDASHI